MPVVQGVVGMWRRRLLVLALLSLGVELSIVIGPVPSQLGVATEVLEDALQYLQVIVPMLCSEFPSFCRYGSGYGRTF